MEERKPEGNKVVCKKPWWWWLPLLLLPLLLMFIANGRIQTNLAGKAKKSFVGELAGITAKANGQSITLRGPAAARDAAVASVKRITGVRDVTYIVDGDSATPAVDSTVDTPETAPVTESVPATEPVATPAITEAGVTETSSTLAPASSSSSGSAAGLRVNAKFDGTTIVLTGATATEAQRTAIFNAAKAVFADANVDNQMTVNGSGESVELDTAAKNYATTFAAMKANLTGGEATLANTVLTVTGTSSSEAAKSAVDDAVKAANGTSTVTAVVPDSGAALEASLNKLNTLKGINFETNSDVIKDESKPTLDEAAATIKEFFAASTAEKVEIGGHTDSVGSDTSNQDLSERRANSVLAYLKDKGVDTARVSAVGYGESKPVADNATEDGKAKNRRIEFTVSGS